MNAASIWRRFRPALLWRGIFDRIRRRGGPQPITIITGTGRCGTSFVAQVFREASIDPGGGYNPHVRAGWEYAPVVAINDELMEACPYPTCADSERLLPSVFRRLQTAVEDKTVVKDPRFSGLLDLWVHAGLVKRVILLVRPIEEAIASSRAKGGKLGEAAQAQRRIDYTLEVCGRHAIPHSVIRFPQVVREEGEDYCRLAHELERLGVSRRRAFAAIRAVRDPSMVHHSPDA